MRGERTATESQRTEQDNKTSEKRMGNWQNFYLQKMGTTAGGAAYDTYESVAQWGVWCREIPFKIFEKAKEPSSHNWHDEHGDDEYIPADGLYMEAYSIKVSFGCKLINNGNGFNAAAVDDVRSKVGQFLEYLRASGMMYLYSSYTRIGRRNVRLESVSDNAKWKSENGEEWLTFDVTFKVNDPVTNITLTT